MIDFNNLELPENFTHNEIRELEEWLKEHDCLLGGLPHFYSLSCYFQSHSENVIQKLH